MSECGCKDTFDGLIIKAYEVMGNDLNKAAKLTTKQRKNLKSSTFCGPGRSFPVNDCAHYTAALRLLNRSKFSSDTKAKIRSCVNAKGKKMGCGGARKAKSYLIEQGVNVEDIINLSIFESTRQLVEESIKNPEMELFDETKN